MLKYLRGFLQLENSFTSSLPYLLVELCSSGSGDIYIISEICNRHSLVRFSSRTLYKYKVYKQWSFAFIFFMYRRLDLYEPEIRSKEMGKYFFIWCPTKIVKRSKTEINIWTVHILR